jgi:hypothetical protein
VRSISIPIAGILAGALLDHRWSWSTLASILVAGYCHWLYRSTPVPPVTVYAWPPEDELRPGWAARWNVSSPWGADHVWPKWSEGG